VSDRLFESAFDGAPEPERLSAPEAAELKALRALKADLAALREVPECQLTTEHLRRAILDQGVRPAAPRVPAWSRWLWAAPVAAVAAVALVLNRPRDVVPTVRELASAAPVESAGVPKTSAPLIVDGSGPAEPATVASATQPSTDGVARPERPRRRTTRRLAVQDGPLLAMREDAIPATRTRGATSEAAPEEEPAIEQPEAVVVTEPADPATGTAAAQEVTISADVVFGG
jgi:hypothetical protein